jgi:AcrR family transcriptional regulator
MTDDGTTEPRRPTEESEGRRGRGRPRSPEVDETILRAARELFLERGIDGMSMERVAKRAGVSKVTVYRRWSSKEDLLLQAMNSLRQEFLPDSWMPENMDDPAAIFAKDRIKEALPAEVEMFMRPEFRVGFAQLLAASIRHPALLRAWNEQFVTPRKKAFFVALDQLIAAGAMPADTDLEVLWDMYTGAVMSRLLLRPEPPDAEELRSFLITLARQTGMPIPEDIEDA